MFPNRVFLGIGRGEALNEVTSVFDIVSMHWHELPYISPVHGLVTSLSAFLFSWIMYL